MEHSGCVDHAALQQQQHRHRGSFVQQQFDGPGGASAAHARLLLHSVVQEGCSMPLSSGRKSSPCTSSVMGAASDNSCGSQHGSSPAASGNYNAHTQQDMQHGGQVQHKASAGAAGGAGRGGHEHMPRRHSSSSSGSTTLLHHLLSNLHKGTGSRHNSSSSSGGGGAHTHCSKYAGRGSSSSRAGHSFSAIHGSSSADGFVILLQDMLSTQQLLHAEHEQQVLVHQQQHQQDQHQQQQHSQRAASIPILLPDKSRRHSDGALQDLRQHASTPCLSGPVIGGSAAASAATSASPPARQSLLARSSPLPAVRPAAAAATATAAFAAAARSATRPGTPLALQTAQQLLADIAAVVSVDLACSMQERLVEELTAAANAAAAAGGMFDFDQELLLMLPELQAAAASAFRLKLAAGESATAALTATASATAGTLSMPFSSMSLQCGSPPLAAPAVRAGSQVAAAAGSCDDVPLLQGQPTDNADELEQLLESALSAASQLPVLQLQCRSGRSTPSAATVLPALQQQQQQRQEQRPEHHHNQQQQQQPGRSIACTRSPSPLSSSPANGTPSRRQPSPLSCSEIEQLLEEELLAAFAEQGTDQGMLLD